MVAEDVNGVDGWPETPCDAAAIAIAKIIILVFMNQFRPALHGLSNGGKGGRIIPDAN